MTLGLLPRLTHIVLTQLSLRLRVCALALISVNIAVGAVVSLL